MSINMEGYYDVPDYAGYCPNCPECGNEMGYSDLKGEFKCSECGYILDEDDWDHGRGYEDEDEIPWGCVQCGGDYPNCKTSCTQFDD